MTSLREQVEKRIAGLKHTWEVMNANVKQPEAFNGKIQQAIYELEQVLALIDELAKELERKKMILDVSVPGAMRAYYEGGVNDALTTLVGNHGESR